MPLPESGRQAPYSVSAADGARALTKPLTAAFIAAVVLCMHSGPVHAARDKDRTAAASPEISEK